MCTPFSPHLQSSLLSAGYIPSKITFRAMTDGLRLQSDMPLNALMKKKLAEPPEEKFKFLLFILDSLETRKLTVDSTFYASILILGAQAGGLQKRIASIITRSRNNSNQKEISLSGQESSDELPPEPVKWEDLLANYSEYKEELGSTIVFPSVRVSSKDFGRVLAAEQAVAFRGNTPRRR